MDRENVISGLQYTVEMFLFDPATGYSKDPDYLNAADRITYDACIGAIAMLKEQEAVNIATDFVDGFGNRISHCPSCNSRLVWHQNKNYCGECGRKVKWNVSYRDQYLV